ncbi:hypothetical protein QQF64_014333 [Cirrhinus molitorella]|uniref:Uncharacterized protein n=1 Tax=Cirrhinus molitorella TaxID=172907 RepID=A0ABR3NRT0_9TELE
METAPSPLTCFEKLVQQGCQTVTPEYSSLVRDDLCAGPISAVRRSVMRDPGTGSSGEQQTYIPIVPFSKLDLLSLDDTHTAVITLSFCLLFCLAGSQTEFLSNPDLYHCLTLREIVAELFLEQTHLLSAGSRED